MPIIPPVLDDLSAPSLLAIYTMFAIPGFVLGILLTPKLIKDISQTSRIVISIIFGYILSVALIYLVLFLLANSGILKGH